jgi:predicted O-methyltransferase YrrM
MGSVPLLLPQVEENAIVHGVQARVVAVDDLGGGTSIREQVFLARLVKQLQPRTIFEFGTLNGRSTTNMAVNAPRDCRILTLDLPPSAPGVTRFGLDGADEHYAMSPRALAFEGLAVQQRIERLFGDSADFDFSSHYGTVDLVLVDAAHTADYVLNDSEEALKLASPTAVIIWHDYDNIEGVTRVLNYLKVKRPAFRELVRLAGTRLAILGRPRGHGADTSRNER